MQTTNGQRREHFWDALRAFLMLLGIPYHVALSYQPGQDFIVHSGEGVPGFSQFADAVHLFRMPAFFVIAGYFALLLLDRREPMDWLKGRFMRLGLPLLTCLVTLVPLMNMVCELSNLPTREAVQSWRENSLTSGGYWVRHLWFIIVLLYFSTAAAMLVRRWPRLKSGRVRTDVDRWCARNFAAAMFLVGVTIGAWEALALEGFYRAGLNTNVPQQILRLDEAIIFVPWFVLGGLLVRARATLERATRFSLPVAIAALALIASWLIGHAEVAPMVERFVAAFAALTTTQVLIAGARALLDRPMPLVRRMTDASFVIYLFHLPLIALLVWLSQSVPVPPLLKAIAIMILSLGLSYAAWSAIGRIRSMSLLFEGMLPRYPQKRVLAA
jgi:glucan biosynthesis protein C